MHSAPLTLLRQHHSFDRWMHEHKQAIGRHTYRAASSWLPPVLLLRMPSCFSWSLNFFRSSFCSQ